MDLPDAQLRGLLEAAPDPTIIVDEHGKILFVSSQVQPIFGYEPNELLGLPVETLIPECYRPAHPRHQHAFLENPKPRPMGIGLELYGKRKDGTEFPVEISLSPVRTSQGLLVSSTIRDITAHTDTKRALVAAKEVAESTATRKSRLLAAASHDLRQPLQSIGLYLSVLNGLLDQPEQQEISDKICNSLDVMGKILDALLDISKLDSGSITPEKRDFRIQDLLDRIVADNRQQAEEKGIELETNGTDCVVHSDLALLERVIENLVTNAIRYTNHGRVTIDCECGNEVARIAVSDTGVGIPKEALDKVFEEYYQIDNPVRDRRKGLGLGLSIVQHILRLLDHPLDVSSVPGEGSKFTVEVPLGTPDAARAESRASAKAPARGNREPIVLFVDEGAQEARAR